MKFIASMGAVAQATTSVFTVIELGLAVLLALYVFYALDFAILRLAHLIIKWSSYYWRVRRMAMLHIPAE